MRLRYVCVSKTCGRLIELNIPNGDVAKVSFPPVCSCGGTMKKAYSTPVLFRLYRTEITLPWGYPMERSGNSRPAPRD